MKIGLIDVDGHNFPNLALMKLSAYHKEIGDNVGWYDMFGQYDIVYKAKVFTFTPDFDFHIPNTELVITGGTGYTGVSMLPDDSVQPDYSLYPVSKWYDRKTAYGFLTRGCIHNCTWCIVPKKEGGIRAYMDIEDIAQGFDRVILMDNNVLACDYGLGQIEKIVDLGLRVDFNQGLDARIIANNPDIAKLLSRIKWLKPLRMACDSKSQMAHVKKATELLHKYGCKPSRFFVYILLQELHDSYERVNFIKDLGLDAFAQPFRDFTSNQVIPQWQKDMARYVNRPQVFKIIDFKDYESRTFKGFFGRQYFQQ